MKPPITHTPLSFGIELEFALAAYIPELGHSHPCPTESRTTSFKPAPEDYKRAFVSPTSSFESLDLKALEKSRQTPAYLNAATRHMTATIANAGYAIDVNADLNDPQDISQWKVSTDGSVAEPDGAEESGYVFLPIELKSPALWNTPSALKEIESVVKLLTSTYLINTNSSTGMRIHIGQPSHNLSSPTAHPFLKNLMSFLWTFEPQIMTIHPPWRQDNPFCSSLRTKSRLATRFFGKYQRLPRPSEAVKRIQSCETIDDLIPLLGPMYGTKREGAYNLTNLSDKWGGLFTGKPRTDTIEFRQHRGTMDTDMIVNWTKTVLGIVERLGVMDEREFAVLISLERFETWQLVQDGKDSEREKEFGPLFAESRFTIFHLLVYLGLFEPALFYMDKWWKLEKLTPKTVTTRNREFKMMPGSVVEEKDMEMLQKLFDIGVEKIKGPGQRQTPEKTGFDLDHPMWRGLLDKIVEPDVDTDASTIYGSDDFESDELEQESGEFGSSEGSGRRQSGSATWTAGLRVE